MFIKWAINNHAGRALGRIMSGDKEDRAAKIWVEHVRVRHQQGSRKIVQPSLRAPHDKLECSRSLSASAGCLPVITFCRAL